MKKKNLSVMTFVTFDNEMEEGLRAIALCDNTGYFFTAINCVRDGQMGKKDENGVYERKWYGDYISCYGNEMETLRPATPDEVNLYLDYVSLDEAIGKDLGLQYDVNLIKTCYGRNISCVIIKETPYPWWRRLWYKVRGKRYH